MPARHRKSDAPRILRQAIDRKIPLIEIIPGKGSGVLKERVLKFLQQKHIKPLYWCIPHESSCAMPYGEGAPSGMFAEKPVKSKGMLHYHRVEKDSHNFGRLWVHFRP